MLFRRSQSNSRGTQLAEDHILLNPVQQLTAVPSPPGIRIYRKPFDKRQLSERLDLFTPGQRDCGFHDTLDLQHITLVRGYIVLNQLQVGCGRRPVQAEFTNRLIGTIGNIQQPLRILQLCEPVNLSHTATSVRFKFYNPYRISGDYLQSTLSLHAAMR
ncbi:hypothetical protein D3C73_1126380 [compost metagenome]